MEFPIFRHYICLANLKIIKIELMARQLNQQALDHILNDSKLYVDICNSLDVKPVSLPKLVQRNSSRLNTHDIVLMIASSLGVEADDILIDDAKVEA